MPNIIEITDFNAPELDIYARYTEPQLLHIDEPKRGIFIAESPKVIARALDAGYEPVSMLAEKKHVAGEARQVMARCSGCGAGACGKSYECRGGFPLCGGAWHGCGAAYAAVQRSFVPACDPCKHGDGFSDPVDVS